MYVCMYVCMYVFICEVLSVYRSIVTLAAVQQFQLYLQNDSDLKDSVTLERYAHAYTYIHTTSNA